MDVKVSKLEALVSWLALPVYVWQGLGVRRRSERMLPPAATHEMTLKGRGRKLSVLIVGDSSAAGVGVSRFEESLAGRLPGLLKKHIGRPIHVRFAGNNSATSGQIRDFVVPHIEHHAYDYIALNIGTNDAKNFHTGRRFCREFGTLIYALRSRFPTATIIWSGVLDLKDIPALPKPLNRILGIRSRIINRNGRILCAERGALAPVTSWQPIAENFSRDGFHASSEGYRKWAEELALFIADREQSAVASGKVDNPPKGA